jgi:hypothetical protein
MIFDVQLQRFLSAACGAQRCGCLCGAFWYATHTTYTHIVIYLCLVCSLYLVMRVTLVSVISFSSILLCCFRAFAWLAIVSVLLYTYQ